jgi:hypothetical protein
MDAGLHSAPNQVQSQNGKRSIEMSAKKFIKKQAKQQVKKSAVKEPASKKQTKATGKVKPYQQLHNIQSVAEEREEQRKIARGRVDAKERKAAMAARMAMSLSNYPEHPLSGEELLAAAELAGVKPAPKSRKAKKLANKRVSASDRKSARKAARLEARAAKQEARKAAREARAAEREEKKRILNMPQVAFTPAMIKAAIAQAQETAGFTDKRAAKLVKQVERIAAVPPRRLAKRIKTFELRITLMQAVLDASKQAVDDGSAKVVKATAASKKPARGFAAKKQAAKADAKAAPKPESKLLKDAKKAVAKQVSTAEVNKAAMQKQLEQAKAQGKAKQAVSVRVEPSTNAKNVGAKEMLAKGGAKNSDVVRNRMATPVYSTKKQPKK